MAAEDTERVSVSTYVPAYQRATWEAEAESMNVSRSEYVRLMVQAGRRSFDLESPGNGAEQSPSGGSAEADRSPGGPPNGDTPEEGRDPTSDPGGNVLEDRVLDLLSEGSYLEWDELVAGLTEDIEERLDDVLGELQTDNRVRYSGRHGGYTVVPDE
jgi:hypothetical protein